MVSRKLIYYAADGLLRQYVMHANMIVLFSCLRFSSQFPNIQVNWLIVYM